jgi:hypothetical protein
MKHVEWHRFLEAISTSEVKVVKESFNYETERISDLIKKVL